MSNLLQSKPIDTTPQGSKPTTIIQKIIEICKDGSEATRTGAEFGHIKSHQNSVFTYKGNPATYVSETEGIFTFAVLDISGDAPVAHTYTVGADKKITQGEDVEFGGGGTGGIVEKVLELPIDFEVAGSSEGVFRGGSTAHLGEEVYLIGNQIQEGGLLYNARITGIEAEIAGNWYDASTVISADNIPIIATIPFVSTEEGDDYTFIAFTKDADQAIASADKIRVHYIELAGIEIITPSQE